VHGLKGLLITPGVGVGLKEPAWGGVALVYGTPTHTSLPNRLFDGDTPNLNNSITSLRMGTPV
jgi:hypothetical protein